MVSDNPTQIANLADVRTKVDKLFSLLARNARLFEEQGFPAAQQAIRSGKSTEAMSEVALIITGMEQVEQQLLKERTLIAQQGYDRAIDMLLVTTILGVGIGRGSVRAALAGFADAGSAAQAVREARDSLEIRVQQRTSELASAEPCGGSRDRPASTGTRETRAIRRTVAMQQSRTGAVRLDCFARFTRAVTQDSSLWGSAANLFRQSTGEEGLDFLARMQHAAARMRKLIDDLLAFSRLNTRAQAFEAVDLNVVAHEVLVDLEARLTQTGGRVELASYRPSQADALQMRQLLQNLIGNALKFHKPGSRPRSNQCPEICRASRIRGTSDSGQQRPAAFEIRVEDDGIGFDPKYLDRIFNVFHRLHGRNEYEGTGIGLAICRKIVERHHGRITAQSQPGSGPFSS